MKFYSKFDLVINKFSKYFFLFGFVVALIALFIAPQPYNLIMFGLYIFIVILKILGIKPKTNGVIADVKTGDPLSFAIVRIYSSALNREITHKVCDQYGRYYCLVPEGTYYMKVEKKNMDESYTPIYTSEPFIAKGGIINRRIDII